MQPDEYEQSLRQRRRWAIPAAIASVLLLGGSLAALGFAVSSEGPGDYQWGDPDPELAAPVELADPSSKPAGEPLPPPVTPDDPDGLVLGQSAVREYWSERRATEGGEMAPDTPDFSDAALSWTSHGDRYWGPVVRDLVPEQPECRIRGYNAPVCQRAALFMCESRCVRASDYEFSGRQCCRQCGGQYNERRFCVARD